MKVFPVENRESNRAQESTLRNSILTSFRQTNKKHDEHDISLSRLREGTD